MTLLIARETLRPNQRFDWSKLCSSLDVIGDTAQAFDSYLKIDEPESLGEKYLNIYGVLQALFIQQDAVTHFSEMCNLRVKNLRNVLNLPEMCFRKSAVSLSK